MSLEALPTFLRWSPNDLQLLFIRNVGITERRLQWGKRAINRTLAVEFSPIGPFSPSLKWSHGWHNSNRCTFQPHSHRADPLHVIHVEVHIVSNWNSFHQKFTGTFHFCVNTICAEDQIANFSNVVFEFFLFFFYSFLSKQHFPVSSKEKHKMSPTADNECATWIIQAQQGAQCLCHSSYLH